MTPIEYHSNTDIVFLNVEIPTSMDHSKFYKRAIFLVILLVSINSWAIEKINVVGLFKDKAILTIDGKQRLLKTGKTSPEGVLLISANSKEAIIEIDGKQRTLKLGEHISSKFKQSTERKSITIAPNSNGMYFVNGSINGFQVHFVVDTGATVISMNRNEAKRMGLNYKLDGKESRSYTANGIAITYIVNLKQVKVGDIEVRDVRASVHDSDHPAVVLLGNSFLSKLDMQREGRVLKLIK